MKADLKTKKGQYTNNNNNGKGENKEDLLIDLLPRLTTEQE